MSKTRGAEDADILRNKTSGAEDASILINKTSSNSGILSSTNSNLFCIDNPHMYIIMFMLTCSYSCE